MSELTLGAFLVALCFSLWRTEKVPLSLLKVRIKKIVIQVCVERIVFTFSRSSENCRRNANYYYYESSIIAAAAESVGWRVGGW